MKFVEMRTMVKRILLSALVPILLCVSTQKATGEEPRGKKEMVRVRYFVNDVDSAIAFYTRNLGFEVKAHPAPSFAILSLGELQLLLNGTSGPGGASRPMPDGSRPQPGGWNRIQITVNNLPDKVELLRKAGVHFRNDIVNGFGGKQILLDDPSGNPIELFEPHSQS
jgi:catechol 2,3-dioxygenase-like lactoylglutathione lyase family enzyme